MHEYYSPKWWHEKLALSEETYQLKNKNSFLSALLVVNRCADLYLGKSLAFEYPLHNQPHLYSPLNGQAYISIALDIAVHLADMDAWDRMMITFDTLSMRSSRVRRAIAYTQAPMVLQLTWERDVVMEQEVVYNK